MPEIELPLVYLVDDEFAVRELSRRILEANGFAVRACATVNDFFDCFSEANAACIVTDLRMPAVDGLQLQQRLAEMGSVVSLIVLTGYADVRTAVKLMEDGVLTLLEKPFQAVDLVAAVRRAVARTDARRTTQMHINSAQQRLDQLSEEEMEVLRETLTGLPNKAIASNLGLSPRTFDRRRQSVLMKMQVQSTAELATLVAQLKLSRRE